MTTGREGAPGEEARPRRPPRGAWEAPSIFGAALPWSHVTSSADDTSPVATLSLAQRPWGLKGRFREALEALLEHDPSVLTLALI